MQDHSPYPARSETHDEGRALEDDAAEPTQACAVEAPPPRIHSTGARDAFTDQARAVFLHMGPSATDGGARKAHGAANSSVLAVNSRMARGLVLFALGLLGCGGANTDGSGGASSSAATTSGGAGLCYSVSINDSTDGVTPCSTLTCKAGTYCSPMSSFCNAGCGQALNCPSKQTCDLSIGMTDDEGHAVGVCRAPKASEEVPCKSGSTSTGSGSDCDSRCVAKATACGAPSSDAQSLCSGICAKSPTANEISCLEGTSCNDLDASFQNGMPVCGLQY